MEGINLIQDLAIVLLVAGLAGTLCKRIGLSAIVGYLVAGIVIGPHTPFSLLADADRIETLSQIGLIFLMFALGLGLSLSRLRQIGFTTLVAAILGAFFVLNATQLLGLALGWSGTQSLFIAALFMVSSTTVVGKILRGQNLEHTRAGQTAMSITALEDAVAIVMLAILSAHGIAAGSSSTSVGGLVAGISAFVVLLVCVGLMFLPKLLRRLETGGDPEIRTIAVAGVLFLMAFLAVKAGYSLALGAFLLGAIVAEIPQRNGIEKAFAGMRDLFSSVFFVAIGLMVDPRLFIAYWPLIIGLALGMGLLRILATGFAMILVGVPPADARRASLALSPIGEFSFLIVMLGVQMAVLPPRFYSIAVGVSILTVLLTALANRYAEPVLRSAERLEPRWLKRGLEIYHSWLAHLGSASDSRLWWKLSRGRLLHIGLELLFITGLFAFSGLILEAIQRSPLAGQISPDTLKFIFWSVLGLVALIPFVALWRNISTLALIFGETARERTRLPGPLVETSIKIIGALGLAYWLSRILPISALSQWSWLIIGVVAAGIIAIFSRRFIYWHSEWQHGLATVLSQSTAMSGQPGAVQRWQDSTDGWKLNVQECELPDHAACAGQSLAALNIRSRFNCTVVEIDRHGFILAAPEPGEVLYSNDRLLLLGTSADIAKARAELTRQGPPAEDDFDECRLEVVPLAGETLPGSTLAELQIPQRHKVLVAGIERDGKRIVNPPGTDRLTAGDHLLLIGAPDRIRAFRQWMHSQS